MKCMANDYAVLSEAFGKIRKRSFVVKYFPPHFLETTTMTMQQIGRELGPMSKLDEGKEGREGENASP
jgi:hypothetical protein